MDRRHILRGIAASVVMAPALAKAVPLPSEPLFFKRSGGMLPPNTANESDLCVVNGKLILIVFNRPPLAQQVSFYDTSNPSSPVLLATRAWPGAMGSSLVDGAGVLHIYGSSAPAVYDNAVIHSAVDANWNISAPNVIVQLPANSGINFANMGAGVVPGGFLLAIGQTYSNGGFAQSFIFSASPDFASYAQKAAFFQGGTFTNQVDFIGRSCINTMPDGWTYITSDSVHGYCRVARTRDFVNFKFASNTNYALLGPGPQDSYPGHPGGPPSYDGNVSLRGWTYGDGPCVYAVYFNSNETDDGALMLAMYPGSLSDLYSRFDFPA